MSNVASPPDPEARTRRAEQGKESAPPPPALARLCPPVRRGGGEVKDVGGGGALGAALGFPPDARGSVAGGRGAAFLLFFILENEN